MISFTFAIRSQLFLTQKDSGVSVSHWNKYGNIKGEKDYLCLHYCKTLKLFHHSAITIIYDDNKVKGENVLHPFCGIGQVLIVMHQQ